MGSPDIGCDEFDESVSGRFDAERSPRQRERRLERFFDSVPDALVLADAADGAVLDVNRAATLLFGRGDAELRGRTLSSLYPPELADATAERFCEHVAAVEPGESARPLEHWVQRADGTRVPVEVTASALLWCERPAILGVFRDISGRKTAEAENERLIDELKLALSRTKQLRGLLPICASCKKIRDDRGYWTQLEVYFSSRSQLLFTHSVCPECAVKLYPDDVDDQHS